MPADWLLSPPRTSRCGLAQIIPSGVWLPAWISRGRNVQVGYLRADNNCPGHRLQRQPWVQTVHLGAANVGWSRRNEHPRVTVGMAQALRIRQADYRGPP